MSIFSTKKSWINLTIWVLIIALIISAPSVLPVFRLNLLGRYLSLAIVALGVDFSQQQKQSSQKSIVLKVLSELMVLRGKN